MFLLKVLEVHCDQLIAELLDGKKITHANFLFSHFTVAET